MPQTNVQKKLSYYERVLEEFKNSPHTPKYDAVCNALGKLVELSRTLNNPETAMSQKDFADLNSRYKAVQDACSAYLAAEKEFSKIEKDRQGIVKDIAYVVSKDMSVLGKCNPEKPGTLSELIAESRSHTLVISSGDFQAMGGALSSRIPLKTSSGKRGFFTAGTTYNQDKKWEEIIDKHIGILGLLSQECKDSMEAIRNHEHGKDMFCNHCPPMPIEEYLSMNLYDLAEKYTDEVAQVLGGFDTIEEGHNFIERSYGAREAITDFIRDIAPLVNQRGIMEITGIKKDAPISIRNCAMSDMAKLLGCDGLLANAAPMTVVIDGKKVEGVFMETVDGTDISRLKSEDLIFNANLQSFESPEALNQIMDLQVLDFICGNTDRHCANMIYQFEKDDNGKVTLKGIKGIDNDCSFGTPSIIKDQPIMNMVNPESMQFIRKEMLNKILALKPEVIYNKFAAYNLSDEEIGAMFDRIEQVKEALRKGTILEVDNDYWKNNVFLSHPTKNGNYLNNIKKLAVDCTKQNNRDLVKEVVDIEYASDITYKKVMQSKSAEVDALREKMDKAKSLFYDSSEYKLMKAPFETIERITNTLSLYSDASQIPTGLTDELKAAYEDLADKAGKYISIKSFVPYTEVGKMRVNVAKELENFANNTLFEITYGMDKELPAKNNESMEAENEKPMEAEHNEPAEIENEEENLFDI